MDQVKIILTWDIPEGKEEEYTFFHLKHFLPALQNMDLDLKEAWLTAYGDYPSYLAESVTLSYSNVRKIINSDEWDELLLKMEDLVGKVDYKIVHARKGFQF